MNPKKIKTIYMIAICGTGMASLAGLLKKAGYEVIGSDANIYPPMSTLLEGGIPLLQALDTTGRSLGSRLLRQALGQARQMVKEGQPLSQGLLAAGIFPSLSIEMINVGESTGSLPAMLTSVAEFFDEDVNTMMTAALSLIEPAIMIFMGMFVAFVLIALYLPIFSLAENI